MTSTPAEGGCLCGAIRYRASGEPRAKAICHCRSCRLASGAPTVAWVVWNASDFAFTRGQPQRFESSPGIERTFCGRCGTPLTYRRVAEPATIDVTTVTLDAANDFAPTKEIWTAHKMSWEPVNEAIPQYPGSSVKRPQNP